MKDTIPTCIVSLNTNLHELGVPEESMEGLGGLGGGWGGGGRGGTDVRHLVEGLRETSELKRAQIFNYIKKIQCHEKIKLET